MPHCESTVDDHAQLRPKRSELVRSLSERCQECCSWTYGLCPSRRLLIDIWTLSFAKCSYGTFKKSPSAFWEIGDMPMIHLRRQSNPHIRIQRLMLAFCEWELTILHKRSVRSQVKLFLSWKSPFDTKHIVQYLGPGAWDKDMLTLTSVTF